MPWEQVTEIWHSVAEELAQEFRHLDAAALRRFRGDREKLVTYLADAHELTRCEAAETLDDWLAVFRRRLGRTVMVRA
ncbi:hypothetical protein [Histidinibacterium lentulum]|uniref:Uncharacterized protein n=1 Tax=Histidinibacterium lentulum TaxID=2480588 RepID=A0A3N2R9K3_9RHOB|nr:hypothetical protein [Histidinibacterium lentulum]ROU04159.1 hypothetical protein EAT49_01830 [Histidinibacterium lentulum]